MADEQKVYKEEGAILARKKDDPEDRYKTILVQGAGFVRGIKLAFFA